MPDQAGSSRRATIRDVAERAGVSIGTASKALNGKGKLKDGTRDRVITAAGQLKFAPNQLTRGLIEGRSYTIGMITNDRFGRLCGPVMLGAEDAPAPATSRRSPAVPGVIPSRNASSWTCCSAAPWTA